jgi:endonuclease/exonuclease/phosphatase family metal-dependent hydrolase
MIKIAAWNIEGRLAPYSRKGRGSPDHILRSIKHLNADVVLLVEAYGTDPEKDIKIDPATDKKFHELGYYIKDIDYDEGGDKRIDPAEYKPRFRLLYRNSVKDITVIRLANLRNAVIVNCIDEQTNTPFRFIGIHLDDRSETLRQNQLTDLLPILNSSKIPTVMMGDYNAMHGTTLRARLIKQPLIKILLTHIPASKHTKYVFKRTIEMANGSTLGSIESETGLYDVDKKKRATSTMKMRPYEWMPSIRLVDIDHMFVSEDVAVDSFTISPLDGGSDHRIISANVSF